MSDEQSLIVAEKSTLPVFAINPQAIELRDRALSGAALIGKVENASQNESATRAHAELKQISSGFERARKKLKEPLLEAGRQLDRVVASEILEVEKEIGRISALSGAFQVKEQQRVREEQQLQRREVERIERERQAEFDRIARDQREVERKAKEAQELAERAAREATNKKQREEAEAARIEADRLHRAAKESAAQVDAKIQQVEERAQVATLIESQPIQSTRARGQVVKTDWEITVTNPYELAKFHPDCVKIEPLLTPIKQLLTSGVTVKGIRAENKLSSGVRAGSLAMAIEV